jgi:hypothetical protein
MRLSMRIVISAICLLLAVSSVHAGSSKQKKKARQLFDKKMAGEQNQLLGLLQELLLNGYEVDLGKVAVSRAGKKHVATGKMKVNIKPKLYAKFINAFEDNFTWEDDDDDNMVTFDGVVDDDLIEDILEEADLDDAADNDKLINELQNKYRKHRQLLGIYLQNTNDARIRFFLVARNQYGDELFRVDIAQKVSQARNMTRLRFRYLGPELVFHSNKYTQKFKLGLPFNPGPKAKFSVQVVYFPKAEDTLYSQGKLRAGEGVYEPYPALAKLEAALLNYNAENYSPAQTAFHEATELDPKLVEAWVGLGLSLLKLGKYKEGNAALTEAEKLRKSPTPWLKAARLLGEINNRKIATHCLNAADHGLKIAENPALLAAAARCALNKRKYKKALSFAEQGLKLGNTAALHALAGLAQVSLRKKKDARASLDKAKKLDINNTALAELAKKLKVKLK